MKAIQSMLWSEVALVIAAAALGDAQDGAARKELRRVDLSGAPDMEVVLALSEYKPGDELPVHLHHGVEAGYVLEGGMVEAAGTRRSSSLRSMSLTKASRCMIRCW